jgi:hypothetical protein
MGCLAYLEMLDGPLDGLEIKWPNNGGDFPASIQFGFYGSLDVPSDLQGAGVLRLLRYEAVSVDSFGPIAEDGLPESETATYLFAEETKKDAPPPSDLW